MAEVPPTPATPTTWAEGPGQAPLETAPHGPSDVHVWLLDLDLPEPVVSDLRRTLDEEEQARAARLRFEPNRSRFAAAHGLIRGVLGSYLGIDPRAVGFARATRGKPSLQAGPADGGPALRFNQSASAGTALLAVSWNREVGVDVERAREGRDHLAIADRFFSSGEAAELHGLAPEVQVAAFYRCWARKEAYAKARGDGLFMPLDSFSVSLAPDRPAALLWSAHGPDEVGRWAMLDLPEIPGFAAALAVESGAVNLRTFRAPRTAAQGEAPGSDPVSYR